jgi:hypothetical protein
MRLSARRSTILVSLALMIASAGLIPAAVAAPNAAEHHSHGPRTVHVRGDQILVEYTAERSTYLMEGDLVGDWIYDPVGPPLYASKTFYSEAGQETFTGCIDGNRNGKCGKHDRRGTMNLTFLYWASYRSDGTLIKGQCVHPITGGTRAFKGARGVLNMYDRLVGDEVKTRYRGDIVLHAVPGEDEMPPVVTVAETAVKGMARSNSSLRKGC